MLKGVLYGDPSPRSEPLSLYITFLIGKIPFHIPTYSRNTLSSFIGSVRGILKGPFNTQITLFPILLYNSPPEILSLLYTSILKKVPLLGGASLYSPLYRVYSTPPPPPPDLGLYGSVFQNSLGFLVFCVIIY